MKCLGKIISRMRIIKASLHLVLKARFQGEIDYFFKLESERKKSNERGVM